MNKVISESRAELSDNAPAMTTIKVHPDKIRDIIGKGGATIRGIVEETGAEVDIDDDGLVRIYAENAVSKDAAIEKVNSIIAEAEVGKIYHGKVERIVDFGAFVNILPGKDGLLHISQIKQDFEQLTDVDWKWNELGAEFYNMGLMVINSKGFLPYLKGQTPKQFLDREEFKDFVDGVGYKKWSTDQMLLNWWIKKESVPTLNMDWRWNALYKGIDDKHLPEAYFIHFFLKDLLPQRGENISTLMESIG